MEAATGLWSSTFLVQQKGLTAETAARWVSLFYLGITVGRGLAGIFALRFNNKQMIRMGECLCLAGCILLVMPGAAWLSLIGLICVGLGCAPIYPAMLHDTPNRFGRDISQSIMGIQMATAYVGCLLMPPFLGFLGKTFGFGIHPFFLLTLAALMLVTSEQVNRVLGKRCAA